MASDGGNILMSHFEIKALAKAQLNERFLLIFLGALIVYAIMGVSIPVVVGIVIAGPFLVGWSFFLLDVVENNSRGDRFYLLFEGFRQGLATSIIAHLIREILVFLYMLLLIVPGVIKALSYSMVTYIIADDPGIKPWDALKKSEVMLEGHKMRLFILLVSFFWWYLLGMLTLGIAFIYVIPYVALSITNFYVELRGKKKVIIDMV